MQLACLVSITKIQSFFNHVKKITKRKKEKEKIIYFFGWPINERQTFLIPFSVQMTTIVVTFGTVITHGSVVFRSVVGKAREGLRKMFTGKWRGCVKDRGGGGEWGGVLQVNFV